MEDTSMLKLAYVGGLGLMAGPAGTHLKPDGPAKVLRVHDRGNPGAQRDAFRASWKAHGAELVGTFDALVGDGKLDGVVVCAGKNGDDVRIVAELARLLQARCDTPPFILHMSTVSAGFTVAAHAFCTHLGIGYVNYPLTGGPLGAQLGGGHPNGMLILASGDQGLYERLEPTLKVLGRPKYFGPSVSAGAETKLIGQHLVFDGCTGISTRHAVVDAIYAAKLAQEKGLPRFSIQPMLNIALAFAFVLRKYPQTAVATHAIARELTANAAPELDAFMSEHGAFGGTVDTGLASCIATLPSAVQQTVLLNVSEGDF